MGDPVEVACCAVIGAVSSAVAWGRREAYAPPPAAEELSPRFHHHRSLRLLVPRPLPLVARLCLSSCRSNRGCGSTDGRGGASFSSWLSVFSADYSGSSQVPASKSKQSRYYQGCARLQLSLLRGDNWRFSITVSVHYRHQLTSKEERKTTTAIK